MGQSEQETITQWEKVESKLIKHAAQREQDVSSPSQADTQQSWA